jgi:hypothetical protein
MAHAWVPAYDNAFTKRQQKLCDYQSNCNIAMVTYFMCAEIASSTSPAMTSDDTTVP